MLYIHNYYANDWHAGRVRYAYPDTLVAEAPFALAEARRGALFVANHSGGKDSAAMLIAMVISGVPLQQIVVVHASLGEAEWPGALEYARDHAQSLGLPFVVARAGKTLFDMVERRHASRPEIPCWPSASTRQCTSDLKRGPIAREVRRFADANGYTRVISCMGFRADESSARSKRSIWLENRTQTNGKRTWIDWLPIHSWSVDQVFKAIRAAGRVPHPAYRGNDRLSCVFCIMGSDRDIQNGARENPELFEKYADLEDRTGYTMHMSRRSLREIASPADRGTEGSQ